MISCDVCLSVSGWFYLAWSSTGLSMLSQVAEFPFVLRLKTYAMVCIHHISLPIPRLTDFCCFRASAVENNAAITCMFQYLFKTFLPILLGLYSKVELLGHMIILSLTFQSNQQVDFHSGCSILHSYQQWIRILISLHPCQHLSFSSFLSLFFDSRHLKRCEVAFTRVWKEYLGFKTT